MTESISRTYSRGKVNNVVYNDRCGYAIVFYDPIYDLDTKIPPLRVQDLPYTIPLQRKALKSLKPAGKPVSTIERPSRNKAPGEHETAEQFIHRKIIERKMDEVRELCANIKNCYKKTEKFDLKRREVISPRLKSKLRGKTSNEICDVLVDDVMQNVDYVYEKNLEEKGKTQRKLALAALRRAAKAPKPLEKIQVKQPNLKAVEEEDQSENNTKNTEEKLEQKTRVDKKAAVVVRPEEEKPAKASWEDSHPPPLSNRGEFVSDGAYHRRHMEKMSQRAADALLFEMTYGRMLRRIRNEIRRLKETYG